MPDMQKFLMNGLLIVVTLAVVNRIPFLRDIVNPPAAPTPIVQ